MNCAIKNARYFLLFLTVSFSFSCENESVGSNQLIGEWVRNDFREDFEFTLIFHADNTGYKIERNGTKETNITSSLITFDWEITNNKLNIIELNQAFLTNYSFNENDQLILHDYSDLPFNKAEN